MEMTPEQLIREHGPRLRSLAASLVGEGHADDVLQRAWVAVWKAKPRHPRAWLERVVRRIAHHLQRNEATAQERERHVARPEAGPDAAAPLELREALEALAAGLAALPVEWTEVLLLRHADGLPPREVAKRLGIPVNTVRSRSRRGLDRLRGELERGEMDWRSAIAFLVVPASRKPATATTIGALLMSTKTVMAITLVLASLIGLAAFELLGDGLSGTEDTVPALGDGTELVSKDLQGSRGDALSPESKEALSRESLSSTSAVQASSLSDDWLTGEVRDRFGQPVEGAMVRVRRGTFAEMVTLDLADYQDRQTVGSVKTSSDGSFSVAVPPHRELEVAIEGPPHAPALLSRIFGGEHLEVTLVSGAVIEGRVVDAATGHGVPDVPLRVMTVGMRTLELPSTVTDATGSYRLEALPKGRLGVWAEPDGFAQPAHLYLEVVPGQVVRREFELVRGVTVSGRVLDAATGAPIEGAEVGADWFLQRSVYTDEHGLYVLHGFGTEYRAANGVYARASGYGRAEHSYDWKEMSTEDLTLILELSPGRAAIGRVVGPDGKPLAGVYIAAVAFRSRHRQQSLDWQVAHTGPDGNFRVEDLAPDLRHKLLLRAEGFGTAVYVFPPSEEQHPVLDLGTIALAPGGRLLGVVVDEHGLPRPGLRLELTLRRSDESRWLPEGGTPFELFYTDQVESLTDSRGRFHFSDIARGEHTITVIESGRSMQPSLTVDLGAGETRDDLVVVAGPGLAISGVVHDPAGKPCGGIVVSALTPNGDPRIAPRDWTDQEGAFNLTGLTPGPYRVRASPKLLSNQDPAKQHYAVTSEGVAAGTTGVVLRLRPGTPVSGVVLHTDGSPATDRVVLALDVTTGERLAEGRSDTEGSFRLVLPVGVTVDLMMRSSESVEYADDRVEEPGRQVTSVQRVVSGVTDVILRLED